MKNIFVLMIMFMFVSACVSTAPVYKQNYDFTKIKTVYVENFGFTNSGKTIQSVIIKQLLSKGYNIKSTYTKDVDIIIDGNISQYEPSETYLVRDYSDDNENTIIYNDSPFEINGSTIYDAGTAFGMDDARLYSTTATVGVTISMKDPKTNEIVWTNSYTYEGFDIETSTEGVVKHILKSFPPQLKTGE